MYAVPVFSSTGWVLKTNFGNNLTLLHQKQKSHLAEAPNNGPKSILSTTSKPHPFDFVKI